MRMSNLRRWPAFAAQMALLGLLPLLPLCGWQGVRVRRTALRLPEADGPRAGRCGMGQRALSLLVIGESPVAGVGVERQEDALPARLAGALADLTGQTVCWEALGVNGLRLRDTPALLTGRPLHADVAVLVFGVNDTTALTSRASWARALLGLQAALGKGCSHVCYCPVAPIEHFPLLPNPLRLFLGLRAALLDSALRRFCRRHGVHYLHVTPTLNPAFFAADGYHPSAAGAQAWADQLASALQPLVDSGY